MFEYVACDFQGVRMWKKMIEVAPDLGVRGRALLENCHFLHFPRVIFNKS